MVDQEDLQSNLKRIKKGLETEKSSQQADLSGDGAIAQGSSKAVGRDGILIEGNVYIGSEHKEPTSADDSPAPGEAPFKGLQYFDVEDASLFFGRKNLTDTLLEHIRTQRFLAVVGASGSGKSSIVRAGVVAALQDQPGWRIHIVTPTSAPLETLALALTSDSESVSAAKTLREDMRSDPESLHLYARRLMVDDSKARMLLVVDQFEELFTLCKDQAERESYVNNLMTAVSEEKQGPLTIIITLRADFYHHCMQYQSLLTALEKYQKNIGSMTEGELREAIAEPAQQGGWEFQPGLVDLMLRDVSDEPGALPLLSHALLETWRRRRQRMLTLAGYSEAGGVHGAIAKTAQDTYTHLTSEQQQIARGIFLRLTELGEGTQDTRRRVNLQELEQGSTTVDAVLKVLADARLVTTGKDSVEVAHEVLIREWPTLRLWLDEDREALRIHRHLTETAQGWERNQRDAGDLYRGTRLAQALEWSNVHTAEMSPLEKEYIHACQAEQKRERRAAQKLRILISYVFFTNMILLGITGWYGIPVILEKIAQFRVREMIMISGGPAIVGTEDQTLVAAGFLPRMTLDFPAYQIGKYEVTNYQYSLCMKYGYCTPPISNFEFFDANKKDYPVVYVTLFQANEYCSWLGQRLPTAVEWERAVRGSNGEDWPWGNEEPTSDRANMPWKDQIPDGLLPVNSLPQGTRDGVYNSVGNVWEWTSSYYSNMGAFDPKGYWSGSSETYDGTLVYIQVGGSWQNKIDNASVYTSSIGSFARADVGFRCAADVK